MKKLIYLFIIFNIFINTSVSEIHKYEIAGDKKIESDSKESNTKDELNDLNLNDWIKSSKETKLLLASKWLLKTLWKDHVSSSDDILLIKQAEKLVKCMDSFIMNTNIRNYKHDTDVFYNNLNASVLSSLFIATNSEYFEGAAVIFDPYKLKIGRCYLIYSPNNYDLIIMKHAKSSIKSLGWEAVRHVKLKRVGFSFICIMDIIEDNFYKMVLLETDGSKIEIEIAGFMNPDILSRASVLIIELPDMEIENY